MTSYKLIKNLIIFILLFILFPLILLTRNNIEYDLMSLLFFILMIAYAVVSRKAGETKYDERELSISSKSNGIAMVLTGSYAVLISLISREFDFGQFLPIAIFSVILFQLTVARIAFEIFKSKPNAEC